MPDTKLLYNSRITKVYLAYINKKYPAIDTDHILNYAEMTEEEVEDQAHWFSQYQVDRFHEALTQMTGNPNIAREAGRYSASSEALGVAKHYLLGLLNLTSLYMLIPKVYSIFSRGVVIKGKKVGPNQVEIVSTPLPGTNEKSYQCENRIGMFESVAKLFTSKLADVTKISCFHDGDDCCRYLVAWEKTPALIFRQVRYYALLLSIIVSLSLLFILSLKDWVVLTLFCSVITIGFYFVTAAFEKKELTNTIETQGNLAQDLLDEMKIRHDNALLIQEIGQATSSILDIDTLIKAVVKSMEIHMGFDRGLIMIANENKTRLIYKSGYGYSKGKKELLHRTEFHLDKPGSTGVFVLAFKNQKPFLINDFSEIETGLSPKSLKFAKEMKAQSMICAPIIYEKESLGILTVDNLKSKKALTKSDLNVIMGIAAQMAISIVNAMSFKNLQKSEKKYRDLVENANSIIMRRDVRGKVTFFNEFAQKFFGYTAQEIRSNNPENPIFQNSMPTRRELDHLISSITKNPERPITSENEIMLRNQEKAWITWTYKGIFDESEQLQEILCIGNDITELKNAELDKKDLETRLHRARKMEAIGTLAGGVAHDLNNILSGIVSYPELLLADLPPDSHLKNPITTIQKAGERAAAIVQDLLTLARRGVVSTKVVNLNTIISDYLNSPEFANLMIYHPNVNIKTQLEKPVLNILGSPIHLTKTIMNLVSNAAEAISDSGEITITTKNRYVDHVINGFDKVSEGDYVTLSISDTGIGISPQDIEKIFEPFYTKKVMGKSGTGLGMAVVWGTIKDHHGYIDVTSRKGKGTLFTLYFPITRQNLTESDSPALLTDLQGNGESILVVDDMEEQRKIASAMLTKLGYSVVSVSSGEEAIDYLKKSSADLLLLDMILEDGIDGLETYKKILEFNPKQKAIITSGFSETTRVKEAQRLGAKQYVRKPYLFEIIGKAIRHELNN